MSAQRARAVCLLALILASGVSGDAAPQAAGQVARVVPENTVPLFQVEPLWPKPLPNSWTLGWVGGLVVDKRDHVWIVHVGSQLSNWDKLGGTSDPPRTLCCKPAPPVIEFDQAGNIVQTWGGPGQGYDWPSTEHGLFIDHKDNVWITSSQNGEGQVLKFTRDGRFLLQIGKKTRSAGSNDTSSLGGPAGVVVDPTTSEVIIADGYQNRRVIVFDAETGAYKRHWGAYGEKPDDAPFKYVPGQPLPRQMSGVHCLAQSTDGLLYVCDRASNRIQVFKRDGAFALEGQVEPTLGIGFSGTVHHITFSHDKGQRFLYVADGANAKIWILQRSDLKVLGSFGHGGHGAGAFITAHTQGVDSKGNLYVGESTDGKRVQKFVYRGLGRAR